MYDLLCQDGQGRTILVELQQVRQAYFKDRTLFYVSHLLRRQGQAGVDWDYQLLPVYAIAILNHRLEKKGCLLYTSRCV